MVAHEPLLKTQQVAQAFRVSGSTIKRWVDSGELPARRTVGRHRLIPLSEALRFGRRLGLPVSELQRLGEEGETSLDVGAVDDRLRGHLFEALHRGDARRVESILEAVVAPPLGAAVLADELIQPVMEQLGHGWEEGLIDVYQEHAASQLVASSLMAMNRVRTPSDRPPGPMAIGATPEGDPYQLGLLLGELTLREEGWDVRNLGTNLPLNSLANAVRSFRPRLVFLSVSYLIDIEAFIKDYLAFYETAAAYGVAVVIGGQAVGPELRTRLVYASIGERMADLVELARRIAPPAGDARAH